MPRFTLKNSCEQVATQEDFLSKIFWCTLKPVPRPCFNIVILKELLALYSSLQELAFSSESKELYPFPFQYIVTRSNNPLIFNYGGDLEYFVNLIQARDKAGLLAYAKLCIDSQHLIYRHFDLPVVTIALAEGDAFGGGFEMLLTHDLIIAERKARFGMTEILFNHFPGMGAYSFLARRLNPIQAEKMILSGKIYKAEELFEMGIIDILAEDGAGEKTLHDYLQNNSRKFETWKTIFEIRKKINPISHQELLDITSLWVERTLTLEPQDIRKMQKLANSQLKKSTPTLKQIAQNASFSLPIPLLEKIC